MSQDDEADTPPRAPRVEVHIEVGGIRTEVGAFVTMIFATRCVACGAAAEMMVPIAGHQLDQLVAALRDAERRLAAGELSGG